MSLTIKYVLAVITTAVIIGPATYLTVSAQTGSNRAALQTTIDNLNTEVMSLNQKVANLTPPTITPTTSFLVIKELGIKLPLTSEIKDLVYAYKPATYVTSPTPIYLQFSTKSISSITNAPNETCNTDLRPLGTYAVYNVRQTNEGSADNQAGTPETIVNGYYIYYHHVQYACGDTLQDQTKVAALIAPLLTAIQKAVAN